MKNRKSYRAWEKRTRDVENKRFRFWNRGASQLETEEERIQDEIEQNQYLWAEFTPDVSTG